MLGVLCAFVRVLPKSLTQPHRLMESKPWVADLSLYGRVSTLELIDFALTLFRFAALVLKPFTLHVPIK